MVVSAEVIRSKAIFHVAWVLGTGDARKLTRREILNQNLPDLCNSIIDMVPERDRSYATKAGLYLLSLLTYGTVLIHRVQVEFLQKDVEKLKELMKKKSFIMLIADRFDREQEMLRQEQSRARLRSTPIFSMEDIDDLVNLANLPMISEQLGINGDPRDFTMMDALPNLVQWNEINPDLTGLYGSVEPFSSQNYTMHSTFVEGNGSDEHSKEKRTAAVIHDFEDFVLPQRTIEQKSPIRADSRKRSAFVSDQEQEQRPLVEPVEQAPLFDSTVQNNELPKPVGPEVEPMKFAQWPLIDEVEAPIPLQRSSHDTLQVPLEEPQQVLPAQLEDLDLVNVPASQQEKVAAYLDSINNLPDDSTKLPPLPNDLDLFEEVVPPPAKKQRVGEVELEIEDLEHARRRPSSRPLTPINQTDLTDLHSTVRMDEPILEMDSQIRDILPQRKRSKRNLPFHGDDLEIDVAVQKVLVADWSTLVRKKEEVLVKIPEDPNCASLLMDYPEPVFSLGNKLCKEVREMFKSGSYQEFEGSAVSDIGEEKFGTICLLSPTRNETQNEISQQQQFMFDEEYRPRQFDELNQQVQDDQLVEERRHEGLPLADATMPITNLKYAFKNLLPTPEKQREATIMEDLNLDAIPIAGNLENLDFFNPNNQTLQQGDQFETLRSDDDVENVRRRQKSSLGVRHQRTDHLEEDTLEIARRQRAFEQEERLRLAMEAKEDDMYFFSSGSLLPNNRLMIHEEILKEAEAKYPEWVDFNQFTADHGSKKAATAFEGLLLSLKNMKVQAKQDEPFGTIFVQHIEQ